MDFTVQWSLGLLKDLLPSETHAFLSTHVANPSSPLRTVTAAITSMFSALLSGLYTLLAPLLDRLARALATGPDVVVLAVFVVVVVLLIQLVFFVQRIIAFWVRLALRLVLWAAVAVVVAIVWQRGLERSFNDGMYLASRVAGFFVGAAEFFAAELARYNELERMKSQSPPKMGPGAGAGPRRW
ncbi:hypothetical protein QBC47DRAFT_163543 [Echria macrotheca]|uniref:Uncharacterized protein n=1 Tax=Echria macrotheca TaxID=438768 RepID=A0AAJ0F885_9PEZI|nr:hypothetical protein QBC47DRAFT_163543 [Echria macrotheca]